MIWIEGSKYYDVRLTRKKNKYLMIMMNKFGEESLANSSIEHIKLEKRASHLILFHYIRKFTWSHKAIKKN